MSIGGLWDQLVDCVCRPPRDDYIEEELIGGAKGSFSIGNRKFYREDVVLENKSGLKLQASHFRPCIVPSQDGLLPVVVYCHCNSGSRRDAEEAVYLLLPHNITVFCLDFAGSGLSQGQWVTLGYNEVEDLDVAVDHLRKEGSCSYIGLWGRSMGAVTALLYSCRDPSIAGIVLDSPFSRLTDLMMELVEEQRLRIPRPLMKVALSMMRRSVKKRAGFSIEEVSPLDRIASSYIPALFGHADGDTFIPKHHSERLYASYAGDDKNMVGFDGNHNSMRPPFFYHSVLFFFKNTLRLDDMKVLAHLRHLVPTGDLPTRAPRPARRPVGAPLPAADAAAANGAVETDADDYEEEAGEYSSSEDEAGGGPTGSYGRYLRALSSGGLDDSTSSPGMCLPSAHGDPANDLHSLRSPPPGSWAGQMQQASGAQANGGANEAWQRALLESLQGTAAHADKASGGRAAAGDGGGLGAAAGDGDDDDVSAGAADYFDEDEDELLERAIRESLRLEQEKQLQQQQAVGYTAAAASASSGTPPLASGGRGEAAAAGVDGLSSTSPDGALLADRRPLGGAGAGGRARAGNSAAATSSSAAGQRQERCPFSPGSRAMEGGLRMLPDSPDAAAAAATGGGGCGSAVPSSESVMGFHALAAAADDALSPVGSVPGAGPELGRGGGGAGAWDGGSEAESIEEEEQAGCVLDLGDMSGSGLDELDVDDDASDASGGIRAGGDAAPGGSESSALDNLRSRAAALATGAVPPAASS